MRKLIAVLTACAGAMGLHAATTGTSFEGLIPEGETSINYVDAFETSGSELDTTQTPGAYWDVDGNDGYAFEEGGFVVTTNLDGTAACSSLDGGRHSQFSGDANIGFLAIETKKGESVTRYANPGVHEAVAIANEGSYYFDSLVQFTPFETNKFASEVLGSDGKLAIWLQAGELDPVSLDPVSAQLVVSAGYLTTGDAITTTNYLCAVDGINIFDGGWHRVTVKEFGSIYNSSNVRTPAFAIAIDGNPVYKTDDDCKYAGLEKSKYSSRALNIEYSSESSFEDLKYNGPILFPSAVRGMESTMSSVSFQGVGAVDDLVFSDVTDREWMRDAMFTIALGENVTGAAYSIAGGASGQIAADTQIPYVENMVVTISNIQYAAGYMKLGCGPADSDVAIVTNAASYEVTVSAANKTVTIDAQAIGATIVNSDSVAIPCATPAAAFALISDGSAGTGPFTVTLNDSVTGGVELNANGDTVILDLAGKTITADPANDAAAILLVNGSLIITNTVGSGAVVGSVVDGVAAVYADENGVGDLTISAGTYDGQVYFDASYSGVFSITDGKFLIAISEDPEELEAYRETLNAAVVAGLGSSYEIAVGTGADVGYYIVKEIGGGGLDPESGVTTVEVTAESADAAEDAAKADITVPDGSGADPSDYAEYFKYGVESIGVNTYEVSITGIVETIEVSVAESAVQRLTDGEATDIEIPAGLYYRITPSDDLPISGTPETGLSYGSVTIGKPGTDKGFYKVELNATPFPVVGP